MQITSFFHSSSCHALVDVHAAISYGATGQMATEETDANSLITTGNCKNRNTRCKHTRKKANEGRCICYDHEIALFASEWARCAR